MPGQLCSRKGTGLLRSWAVGQGRGIPLRGKRVWGTLSPGGGERQISTHKTPKHSPQAGSPSSAVPAAPQSPLVSQSLTDTRRLLPPAQITSGALSIHLHPLSQHAQSVHIFLHDRRVRAHLLLCV